MGHKIVCIHDTVSSARSTRKTMINIATNGVSHRLANGKTRRIPGPLYNELMWPTHIYDTGGFSKITAGKSNNAGRVGQARFAAAKAAKPMPDTSIRPPRGIKTYNSSIYGLAITRPGDGILRDADLTRLAVRCLEVLDELHLPQTPNLVVGHSELTSRKVDPGPWQSFMPQLRARITLELGRPSETLTEPEPASPWYADELAEAVKLGITDGTRPEDPVSRAESAIHARRAADHVKRSAARLYQRR